MSRFPRAFFHRGIWFRSRIEAKWYEFFTRCQWEAVYEPDFDFKDYIVDFLLFNKTVVEIKWVPSGAPEGGRRQRDQVEIDEAVRKFRRSECDRPWVLLGISPPAIVGELPFPPNTDELWLESCNAVQWQAERKKQIHLPESRIRPMPLEPIRQREIPTVQIANNWAKPIAPIPNRPEKRVRINTRFPEKW